MNERQRRKMDLQLARFVEAMTAWSWSPRSVVSYEHNVRVFLDWLEDETDVVDLAEVTGETLSAYQTSLLTAESVRGERLAVGTQHLRLIVVKRFFAYLAHEGRILADRAAGLSLPKKRRRLPQALLTVEEAVRLVEALDGTTPLSMRDRAIVEVLYATGIRNAELRALLLSDVDAASGTLTVRAGKGGKDRVVPTGPHAGTAVTRYAREGRPQLARSARGARDATPLLFVTKNGAPLRALDVILAVGRAAKAAGIGKPIKPHRLRHACATHMLQGGADIRHIQALLGHASLHTTQIYTQVAIADLKDVHRRFHPRARRKR